MTELDKALDVLREKPKNHQAQSSFYDLFLNTVFFVPTVTEMVSAEEGKKEEQMEVPMIIESEGSDYLVFFDEQQRLRFHHRYGWSNYLYKPGIL